MREGERKALWIFSFSFYYFYILLGILLSTFTFFDRVRLFISLGFLIGVDGMGIEGVGKYNIHSFNFFCSFGDVTYCVPQLQMRDFGDSAR